MPVFFDIGAVAEATLASILSVAHPLQVLERVSDFVFVTLFPRLPPQLPLKVVELEGSSRNPKPLISNHSGQNCIPSISYPSRRKVRFLTGSRKSSSALSDGARYLKNATG